MKKGLRPGREGQPNRRADSQVRIAALMKKGLRRRGGHPGRKGQADCPNCCPDEEGIKTMTGPFLFRITATEVRIAALMKKGLRRLACRHDLDSHDLLSELLP